MKGLTILLVDDEPLMRLSMVDVVSCAPNITASAAATVNAGSYFKISPITPTSAAATNITIGNWS